MIRKTDLVKKYVANNEWLAALRIASKFNMLSRSEKKDLVRAFECHHNPLFYEQLGFDPEELKKKGIATLQKLYG